MRKLIFLNEINFDESPNVRHTEREEVVHDYADRYKAKREMPPVVLFWDKDAKKMYLADGKHRCSALEMISRNVVYAEVRNGTYQDALAYALLANSQHGLPRSNADKRKCITEAIKEWPKASNNHISKMCDVHDSTVAAVRAELEAKQEVKPEVVRVSSDGREVAAKAAPKRESPPPSPPPEEKAVVDTLGYEIPKKVLKYWHRAGDAKELLESVSSVIGKLKRAQRDEDVNYAEVNFSGAISDLEKAYYSIKCAVPYVVCTSCQGHPETQKTGCRLCYGKGLISKFRWDSVVPKEVKELRTAK